MSRDAVRLKVSIRDRRYRTLDERLTLLVPGLAQRAATLVFRLSPHSRLRRAVVARNLVSQYAAVNRRDFELILSRCDREAEWVFIGGAKPPDMKDSYRGHAGGVEFIRGWFESWDVLRLEPVEVIDVGDRRLVAIYHQRGRGKGSGVELDVPGAQIITVRNGLATRIETFAHPADALAEVGLSGRAARLQE